MSQINRKSGGSPRPHKVPEAELPTPMGRLARDGPVWRHSLIHRCGARVHNEGYGGSPVIICPDCGEVILLLLPHCKYCGIACSDIQALSIHELDCPSHKLFDISHHQYPSGEVRRDR